MLVGKDLVVEQQRAAIKVFFPLLTCLKTFCVIRIAIQDAHLQVQEQVRLSVCVNDLGSPNT